MNGPGCPTINRRGILGLPYLGRRWGDTVAFVRDEFLDEKGSPSHPGQDSTILGPGSLRQSLPNFTRNSHVLSYAVCRNPIA
jgi:hypothetical protein